MAVPMTKENGIRDDKKRRTLTRSLRTLTRLRRIQTRSCRTPFPAIFV